MRIGTWNLERAVGAGKNDLRRSRLRLASADIWILTETHDDIDLAPTHRPTHSAPRPSARRGERWVSIWSSLPIVSKVPVSDVSRTTAVLLDTPVGDLIVFGTVLPWHSDGGPSGAAPFWAEHYRIIPEQGREWCYLRERFPMATLCVAGDFNMNLSGHHFYGTRKGRDLLREALLRVGLVCVTERVPDGRLQYPPIDHICMSVKLAEGASVVDAWAGTTSEGVNLSDHSGLVVNVAE